MVSDTDLLTMMWSPWQLTKLWGFPQISHSVFSKWSQLRWHHKWPLIWFSLPWPWPSSYNNELYDVIPCSIVFVKLQRFLQLFILNLMAGTHFKEVMKGAKLWNSQEISLEHPTGKQVCNSWVVVAHRIGWLSINQIYHQSSLHVEVSLSKILNPEPLPSVCECEYEWYMMSMLCLTW